MTRALWWRTNFGRFSADVAGGPAHVAGGPSPWIRAAAAEPPRGSARRLHRMVHRGSRRWEETCAASRRRPTCARNRGHHEPEAARQHGSASSSRAPLGRGPCHRRFRLQLQPRRCRTVGRLHPLPVVHAGADGRRRAVGQAGRLLRQRQRVAPLRGTAGPHRGRLPRREPAPWLAIVPTGGGGVGERARAQRLRGAPHTRSTRAPHALHTRSTRAPHAPRSITPHHAACHAASTMQCITCDAPCSASHARHHAVRHMRCTMQVSMQLHRAVRHTVHAARQQCAMQCATYTACSASHAMHSRWSPRTGPTWATCCRTVGAHASVSTCAASRGSQRRGSARAAG